MGAHSTFSFSDQHDAVYPNAVLYGCSTKLAEFVELDQSIRLRKGSNKMKNPLDTVKGTLTAGIVITIVIVAIIRIFA